MDRNRLPYILNLVTEFALSNKEILAVGLCGSWATGTARDDSDVDLTIIVKNKLRFKKKDWLDIIDFKKHNNNIDYFIDKEYGQVWSRHIFLNDKTEIEFSFANQSWTDTENLDEGTRKVILDGFKIIYDPKFILYELVEKVRLPKS